MILLLQWSDVSARWRSAAVQVAAHQAHVCSEITSKRVTERFFYCVILGNRWQKGRLKVCVLNCAVRFEIHPSTRLSENLGRKSTTPSASALISNHAPCTAGAQSRHLVQIIDSRWDHFFENVCSKKCPKVVQNKFVSRSRMFLSFFFQTLENQCFKSTLFSTMCHTRISSV